MLPSLRSSYCRKSFNMAGTNAETLCYSLKWDGLLNRGNRLEDADGLVPVS